MKQHKLLLVLFIVLLLASCSPGPTNKPVSLPYDGPVAQSSSMVPTIQPGQRIHADSFPFSQIQVGDIILYWEEARQITICHRVHTIIHAGNGDTGLLCMGDNNSLQPDWHIVTTANYLGKVTHIY